MSDDDSANSTGKLPSHYCANRAKPTALLAQSLCQKFSAPPTAKSRSAHFPFVFNGF